MTIRFLHIEDTESDALLIRKTLEREGWAVEAKVVSSLPDLQNQIGLPWDVVLADFGVPGMSTLEALGFVREVQPDLPFVVVSGQIGEENAVALMKAGADDYVSKNFPQRLSPILHRVLNSRQAKNEKQELERQFRHFFDQNLSGMAMFTSTGELKQVNRSFLTLLGLDAQQLPDFWSLFPVKSMAAAIRDKLESGSSYGPKVLDLLRLDGRRVSVLATFQISGPESLIWANFIDHTEQQLQFKKLSALRAIDLAIAGSFDLNLTLNVALDQVLTQLDVAAATVLVFNPLTHMLNGVLEKGFSNHEILKVPLGLRDDLPGEAVISKRRFSVTNLRERLPGLPRGDLFHEEGFVVYHAVPILSKGAAIGVLEVFERESNFHDAEWFAFLDTLAGQISIGVDSIQTFEKLQNANLDLLQAYDATIEGWSKALDLRDKETEGHSQRVTRVSTLLAQRMGLDEKQIVQIRRGALLHDIGKMGVPDSILLKPGSLTAEEWEVMKTHPGLAYKLLSTVRFFSESLDIPWAHHEKWDGSGYPRGLKGEAIPLAARLFAVVDVWDALRSTRPYRNGLTWEATKEHLLKGSGSHFDPRVVESFLELMKTGDQEFRK